MSRIDQFESVFKAASRTSFEFQPHPLRKVLLVSDLPEKDAWLYAAGIKRFLASVDPEQKLEWVSAGEDRGSEVGELLEVVEQERPDLICTYRSLYSQGWRWPFSLGEHLDVLTQATTTPVMVMPRPDADYWQQDSLDTRSVIAMTDHLDGDEALVNWSVGCTAPGGSLRLVHVEDEKIFRRYVDDVISKIPEIDTDRARDLIARQLLKDPAEYIDTVSAALAEAGVDVRIERLVEFGSRLDKVKEWVQESKADLLVVATKDDDQMAMHGLTYPIAVELRSVPLLMI